MATPRSIHPMTVFANTRDRRMTRTTAALLVAPVTPGAATAQAVGKWDFTAAIYAYLPTIGGKTTSHRAGAPTALPSTARRSSRT
jgi:hypothetical protein